MSSEQGFAHIQEFVTGVFGELFEVSLGAIAEVNIRLEAKITDDLPSIQADLADA